jgi:spore coat polysaccharide biosynthesis predicted glycosyltransferase SpsG
MTSLKFNKKIAFIVDGSSEEGYGHLYRSKNLAKTMSEVNQVFHISRNTHQNNFYSQHNIPFVELKKNDDFLKNTIFDYIVVDVKKPISKVLQNIHFNKVIVIDTIPPDLKKFDRLITPSFFYQSKKNLFFKGVHNYGENYVILDPRIKLLDSRQKRGEKLIITFGGSDPNNLSLVTLLALKDTEFLPDILLILGPGYKHSKKDLLKIISGEQIIENPSNIYKHFLTAYFAITALGVTVQELAYMMIPMGIIYNYVEDKEDMSLIDLYFTRNNKKNFIYNFNHYESLNKSRMIKEIHIHHKNNSKEKFNNKFGSAWIKDVILD